MTRIILLLPSILFCWATTAQTKENLDYTNYHQSVVRVEKLISSESYPEALDIYEELFESYEFIFLRDYQIATQLALFLKENQKATKLLLKAIESGWHMKSIRKNNFLAEFRKSKDWKLIKRQYPILRKQYESGLNQVLRKRVKKMFSKDQWKALGALFTFSDQAQIRYAEKKFAPHSEQQIKAFLAIFNTDGYPGEQLIGNDFWMSTILSHHNSISTSYNSQDTLYQFFKPRLKRALTVGHISAFEFVLIDEWYRATINDESVPTYGILEGPIHQDVEKTNQLREAVYVRPIEVHNKLVDIEAKTGIHFYLEGHPWEGGKIRVR